MANTYMPRNIPQARMTYADVVDERDQDFRAAGGIKTVRSAPPPPAAAAAPARGMTNTPGSVPSAAQASVNAMRASARPRGNDAPLTAVRRSPLTNESSVEDKIADNELGSHLGADGSPARWNVPTQIQGRNVTTTPAAPAPAAPIPQAPASSPTVAAAPVPAFDSVPNMSPVPAAPPPPVPQQTAARPVPIIKDAFADAPAAPQPGYGGVMGAASAVRRAIPRVARDVASDVGSIVRQVPRALNYMAGGARRLAEGDAERATSAANEQALVGSMDRNARIQNVRRSSQARDVGFSARPAATIPQGTQFNHGLGGNPYTRRVFGDPLNKD